MLFKHRFGKASAHQIVGATSFSYLLDTHTPAVTWSWSRCMLTDWMELKRRVMGA